MGLNFSLSDHLPGVFAASSQPSLPFYLPSYTTIAEEEMERNHYGVPRYFTKSNFVTGLECPTRIYYDDHPEIYPRREADNDFRAALAHGGGLVEMLARRYYPGGHFVRQDSKEEGLRETRELLSGGDVTLYQAAFLHDSFYIRADIVRKRGSSLELIEVKSKSFDSSEPKILGEKVPIQAKWVPLIREMFFQAHVVEMAMPGYEVVPKVMLLDKSKTLSVADLGKRTWKLYNCKDHDCYDLAWGDGDVDAVEEWIMSDLDGREFFQAFRALEVGDDSIARAGEWARAVVEGSRISSTIGPACKKCEYRVDRASLRDGQRSGFEKCWRESLNWEPEAFDQPLAFDINGIRANKIFATRQYHMADIDPATLNSRQALQVHKTLNRQEDGEWLDGKLAGEMEKFHYPLCLIDFETATPPIPFYTGHRPYGQIAFQFSCHTIDRDGTVLHAGEWIDTDLTQSPNYEFVRRLKSVLDTNPGTVFRYTHHERTYLKAIACELQLDRNRAEDAEELIAWIGDITAEPDEEKGVRGMVDLADLVKKYYYHRDMKGSNSIKAVLPAVMNASGFLHEKYSRPYVSTNYPGEGIIWYRPDPATGRVINPYKLLEPIRLEESLMVDDWYDEEEVDDGINNGGAATMAYIHLHYADVPEKLRRKRFGELLRYCELDTLAMAMILEHWKSMLKH